MNLKIKDIRESRGIGQKDAAALAEMKVRTYGSYERGERSISLEDACKLADVFECTLDELAGREWPRPVYADPRQEAINAHYGTFNDEARQDVYKMVERMSHDPGTRIEKAGPEALEPSA